MVVVPMGNLTVLCLRLNLPVLLFGQALQQSCMAMCIFYSTVLSFVFAGGLGINPMDLGLMCLSPCGQRRRQPFRRRKMMMVFVASCVATVLVICPSVALAT